MLELPTFPLRALAAEGWPADPRVRLAVPAVLVSFVAFIAVVAGIGAWVLWGAGALVLAALPWMFVTAGRPYLAEDAAAGVPFAWRGERAGVWATAPIAGFLLALAFARVLGLGALAILLCPAVAAAYTWLLVWVERRHESAAMVELNVLEQRFGRIADSRAAVESQPTEGWVPDFADAGSR